MSRRRGVALAAALVAMGLGACGGSSGGTSRTIEVDYHSDDFAGSFLGFYPRDVTVTPGMTLKFHQNWSGAPHSVTFGTVVDQGIKPLLPLLDDVASGKKAPPDEAPPEYNAELFDHTLPSLFDDEAGGLGQDAAYPCYVKQQSALPLDNKPCAKADRIQPEFTGTYAYYSSGFIPFEGARGNTFDVTIADNAKDGRYFYYCNAHGVPMSGTITVKRGATVESQATLNRRGKAEADRLAKPMKRVLDKERAGKSQFKGNLAGSGDESLGGIEGEVDEFTPDTIKTKVGEKVTWTFIGDHTISFNVPSYVPLFKFSKAGVFNFNASLFGPKGGWRGPPEDRSNLDEPGPPIHIDGGTYDGSRGFKSSGTGWAIGDTYSITFTKAGTYPYACLIHPGMIGKVVVA